MNKITAVALCITIAFGSGLFHNSAASAEPSVACGKHQAKWNDIKLVFTGNWSIEHQAGYARSGAMIIPFGPSPGADILTISFDDNGQMVGTHPEMQEPMLFEWADESNWKFKGDAKKHGVPDPILNSTDMKTVLGCKNKDLARLIGRSRVVSAGVPMDMTLRLMLIDSMSFFGIFHISGVTSGHQFDAWRTVYLNQQ